MIKFSLLLLTVYVIYYAGNITYDLFLKKEAKGSQEESAFFSLSDDFADKEAPVVVGIEDVENLNMPQSFTKKEVVPQSASEVDEPLNLEALRRRFESEQDMDGALDRVAEKEKKSSRTQEQ